MLRPEAGLEARRRQILDTNPTVQANRPPLSLVPTVVTPRGEPTDAIRRFFAETPHDHPLLAVDL